DVLVHEKRVSVNDAGLPGEVGPGTTIFLNGGSLRLTVTSVAGREIHTRIEVGGELSDRKGCAIPSAPLRLPALTDRDRAALATVLEHGVDYVGLSFVRSPADVALLREAIAAHGATTPIVAKIEKAQAIDALDAIVSAADAVMVARGDLGVECAIEEVPT